ncbi:long-chain fatty acid--CoA ligase [Nitrosovibrio sp. Nv6]|uniref:AMP-dependent synthetase/ligase n=1 Tax=Nitrosovibrio sp. Nv6 TaxID=1855340 RepID=UPI0008BB7EEA|nr:AMP-dependent synthetase/ligase [Nitrosovibrio sp. Nv6]SEO44964.1 long-chain acyl-CoA synthetase [Nitrosovibrio sp. Nv6]
MASQTTDIISCTEAGTLPGLFALRIKRTPNSPAYRQFDADSGKWQAFTWREMGVLVERWRRALRQENFAPGDRVAVLLRNSVEWVCFDQAAMALGLVVVPLFPSDAQSNIAYILADSGARLLLTGTQSRWETLAPLCADLAGLGKVLCVQRPTGNADNERVLKGVDDWLAEADQSAKGEAKGQDDGQTDIDEFRSADPRTLATLVYTSGTTGKPKGVMLSHHNILWNAEAVLKAIPGYREDVYLSLLPLSHMFERTVGYYVPIMAGSSVAHARSLKDLAEDLNSVRPRILIGVPQIFAGIRTKMRRQVEEKGPFATRLLDWTMTIGWDRFTAGQHRQGQKQSRRWYRFAWPVLRPLVAEKVLVHLGGRLRLAVSGGGPLYGDVSRYFIGLGLPLIQGYGLTEASPVLAANRLDDNIPESAGMALPGVEIRIGDEGELLVRSPGIMLGYWNRPEDTHAAIDSEGWLHTGDQARISENHVFICGRLKEILVTSSGEKVPPGDLEMAIVQDSLFDQAMIVGEGKPYLAALLVLNQREWTNLAKSLGLKADDVQSLGNSAVRGAALNKIKAALHSFPKYARVRAVHLTLEPWSVENGLLTPTLKLKRPEMEKRFADKIDELYRKPE